MVIDDLEIKEAPDGLLSGLVWGDMPQFAVLIGPNGIGKTALLRHIYSLRQKKQAKKVVLLSSGYSDHVGLKWSSSSYSSVKYHSVDILYDKYQLLLKKPTQLLNKHSHHHVICDCIEQHHQDDIKSLKEDSNSQVLPVSKEIFSKFVKTLKLGEGNFDGGINLSLVFLSHYIHVLRAKKDDSITLISPPWVVLNELFKSLSVPVFFTNPEDELPTSIPENIFQAADFLDDLCFETKLKHVDSDKEFDNHFLSSGEKELFNLALRIFAASQCQGIPDLMLLDEPDAHFHPEMAYKFVNAIRNFSQDYNTQIIFTSHSPTTVSFCPEDSVFTFSKDKKLIENVTKQSAINSLTQGFVSVTPKIKFVFVEDKNDKAFYEALFELAVEKQQVDSKIKLQFVSSGLRKNKSGGGGKTTTANKLTVLMECFENIGSEYDVYHDFKGLVDKDYDREQPPHVEVLLRYCMENYFVDPLVLYLCLVEAEQLPNDAPIKLSISTQYDFFEWSNEQYQQVADFIVGNIAAQLGNSPNSDTEIKYCSGKAIKIPKWYYCDSGKTILQQVRNLWGSYFGNDKIIKTMKRYAILPSDLVQVFKTLQGD